MGRFTADNCLDDNNENAEGGNLCEREGNAERKGKSTRSLDRMSIQIPLGNQGYGIIGQIYLHPSFPIIIDPERNFGARSGGLCACEPHPKKQLVCSMQCASLCASVCAYLSYV